MPGDRDHVEALEPALDALELDRVAIVGNSMSGATATRFAAYQPERVSHLIPMGSPGPGVNQFGPPNYLTEGIRILVRAYLEPSQANFQVTVGALAHDPALAEDAASAAGGWMEAALARPDHMENYNPALSTGELNGPPQLFQDLPSLLAKLTVPTLLVHGRGTTAPPTTRTRFG
ncbi:alpha/beta hydrolase [Streptomyces muensis]|uniref:Alpha/beta fold hydrolase n=1 Tax=Streptomyces muensis TaxID=1077944 RepID=A0A9X1PW32_STRM4|nr:alpha/beta hydrolase [Streptomyces muensis]MCF1594542.1 alpha/beta fold hydrolase [Streptomyces muensis]